ncbi:zinc finger protein ZPR1 [Planococcus citri]|uniref:zinc finger protein ZPR1 n=1 Tax=Planococcus citri TaxID=170843 RepID=UPI0031F7ECF1
MGSTSNAIFRNLNADDPDPETTCIESYCVNCGENGMTRMLLTKIPFYKDVILMSFDCEHCGYQNNEIQSGGRVEEKGVRIRLKVENAEDLNRTLVKSDHTSVKIPELDFEIPSGSQKGEVTTVEGVVDRAVAGLKQDQEARLKEHPEIAAQIEQFVEKLSQLKEAGTPFTMIIEDISGNCFLSNPKAPERDPRTETSLFVRNKDQDHALGIYTREELDDEPVEENTAGVLTAPEETMTYESLLTEVFQLPSNCPSCNAPCTVNNKLTKIPYFKEVLIMATNCDTCGYRSNEVKSGTGIEEKGVRLEVTVTDAEDFTRDVLKSDTCSLFIPELELEVGPATMGGRFTTVEGLLVNIKEQLDTQGSMASDSADTDTVSKMNEFLKKLDDVIACKVPFTLILDDPAGNSYAQSKTPPEPDDKLKITQYERTDEQNDDLGINDMVLDNY